MHKQDEEEAVAMTQPAKLLVQLIHQNEHNHFAPHQTLRSLLTGKPFHATSSIPLFTLARCEHTREALEPLIRKRWNLILKHAGQGWQQFGMKTSQYSRIVQWFLGECDDMELIRWFIPYVNPVYHAMPFLTWFPTYTLCNNEFIGTRNIIALLKEFPCMVPNLEVGRIDATMFLSSIPEAVGTYLREEHGDVFDGKLVTKNKYGVKHRDPYNVAEHYDKREYDRSHTPPQAPTYMHIFDDCLEHVQEWYAHPDVDKDFEETMWSYPCTEDMTQNGARYMLNMFKRQTTDHTIIPEFSNWNRIDEGEECVGISGLNNYIRWVSIHNTEERVKILDFILSRPEYNLDHIFQEEIEQEEAEAEKQEDEEDDEEDDDDYDDEVGIGYLSSYGSETFFNNFAVFKILQQHAPKFLTTVLRKIYPPSKTQFESLEHFLAFEKELKKAYQPEGRRVRSGYEYKSWIFNIFEKACFYGITLDIIEYLMQSYPSICDFRRIPKYSLCDTLSVKPA